MSETTQALPQASTWIATSLLELVSQDGQKRLIAAPGGLSHFVRFTTEAGDKAGSPLQDLREMLQSFPFIDVYSTPGLYVQIEKLNTPRAIMLAGDKQIALRLNMFKSASNEGDSGEHCSFHKLDTIVVVANEQGDQLLSTLNQFDREPSMFVPATSPIVAALCELLTAYVESDPTRPRLLTLGMPAYQPGQLLAGFAIDREQGQYPSDTLMRRVGVLQADKTQLEVWWLTIDHNGQVCNFVNHESVGMDRLYDLSRRICDYLSHDGELKRDPNAAPSIAQQDAMFTHSRMGYSDGSFSGWHTSKLQMSDFERGLIQRNAEPTHLGHWGSAYTGSLVRNPPMKSARSGFPGNTSWALASRWGGATPRWGRPIAAKPTAAPTQHLEACASAAGLEPAVVEKLRDAGVAGYVLLTEAVAGLDDPYFRSSEPPGSAARGIVHDMLGAARVCGIYGILMELPYGNVEFTIDSLSDSSRPSSYFLRDKTGMLQVSDRNFVSFIQQVMQHLEREFPPA